jgi:hypothetical protein
VGLLAAAATLTVASFALAAPAGAALSFSRTDYPLPEGTWTGGGGTAPRSDVLTSAALVDLDHDGKLDIVVANGYTGNVVVLLNQGNGTFAPAQSFAACQNNSLVSDTVAGQLNPQTDQNPDVAVTCEVEGGVWRLLGDGHGALGAPQSISPNNAVGPLLLGHLSNNTYGDLVYQNVASPYEFPCLAPLDGSGGVETSNCFQEDYTHAGQPMTLWHFRNNDCSGGDEMLGFGYNGDSDWAWQDTEYNALYAQTQPSDPPTGPCSSPFHTSGYGHDSGIRYSLGDPRPSDIAAGDLDANGHPDVVMADSGGTVHVQADDAGGFSSPGTPSSFPSAGPISSIKLADFNGDGSLDIAAAEYDPSGVNNNWVAIHLGHGNTTTFDTALKFPVAGAQTNINEVPKISVGDLNGDGKPDLVSVAGHAGVVTVLLNATPAGPSGGGAGGGSGGGGGGSGPKPFAGISVKKQSLVVKNGAVKPLLTCPTTASGHCIGSDTLLSLQAYLVRAGHPRKHKLTLGSAHFSLAPGATARITIKLSRKALKLLAKIHSLVVLEKILAADSTGVSRASSTTITVKSPKKQHRH